MQKARIAKIRQNMSGLPNTKNKNCYENFQALVNVFWPQVVGIPALLSS